MQKSQYEPVPGFFLLHRVFCDNGFATWLSEVAHHRHLMLGVCFVLFVYFPVPVTQARARAS
jgi:hypothetical protein